MKRNLFYVAMAMMALISCSSDGEDNGSPATNSIVGTWDVTELRIDNATASDDAKFGKQILDFLTARNCTIISLEFNEDGSAVAENRGNYVEVNATSTGLDIPCPDQFDTETTTYTYNGTTVTFVDADGVTVEAGVSINGSEMSVNAADLEIPNFNESGQLIFIKR